MTQPRKSDSGRLRELADEVRGMEIQIDQEWGPTDVGEPVADELAEIAERLTQLERELEDWRDS